MNRHADTGRTAGLSPAVRITHWINLVAMVCMVMSGLGIYNAYPILPFHFPAWATLGGWLGGSTIWHFAAMWLLVANAAIYFGYGLLSGTLRRRLFPICLADGVRDLKLAVTFRLKHDGGGYNTIQKALYVGVLAAGVLMVASGLAIWKPVQFAWLTALFGGFATARIVHFAGMSAIVAFTIVHVAMVAIVPSTLRTMTIGTPRGKAGTQSDDRRNTADV